MMSQEVLTWVPAALILLLLALFFFRRKRVRHDEVPELAYLGFSEPAAEADADFRAVFEGMIPAKEDGVDLLRVSVANRGKGAAEPGHFAGPIRIVLPVESRVLDVKPAQVNGLASLDGIEAEARLNTVTVAPFTLPQHSSVIFNIVVEGAAVPFELDGSLTDYGPIGVMR